MTFGTTNPSPIGEDFLSNERPVEPSRYFKWSLAVIALIAIAVASPSVLVDKEPFNYDESVFVMTGTYFSSAADDVGSFLRDPANWSREYYNQYPAISLRRHPPLFFFFEGLAYKIFGTNLVAARLCLMAFTVSLSCGFFLVAHRFFKDSALAITATLLLLAITSRLSAIQEVWLDVPTMAWAIWGLFFWDLWRTRSGIIYGIGFALCSLCALYTYQLSLFLIVAMFGIAGLYWILPRFGLANLDVKKPFPSCVPIGIGFFILSLPLVIFTVVLGMDQLQVATGKSVEEFASFKKADSSFSLESLLFYPKTILQVFPIALAGVLFFAVSRVAGKRKFEGLDGVLLTATFITFAGFTVVSSGGVRYAWYIVVPTVIWATEFIGWIASRIAPRSFQSLLCLSVAGALLIESAGRDYSIRFTTDPVDMQRAFELVKEKKHLLYSGPYDCRFILTVRFQDPRRERRVFRGTVHIKEKDDLKAFIEKNQIDAVLIQYNERKRVSKEYQALNKKIMAQLPELGFYKIETLQGQNELGVVVPMLDVFTKR